MLSYEEENTIDVIVEDYESKFYLDQYINDIDEKAKYFITVLEKEVKSIVSIKHLEWDSNIFNKKIGLFSVCYGSLQKETYKVVMNDVDKVCKEESFECIFAKVNVDDYSTMHILESSGYNLMDSIVTFKIKLNLEEKIDISNKYTIILLNESDVEDVVNIIDNLYRHGRFFEDENLDNNRVNELYKLWITNEIKNSKVDVIGIKENDKLLGFISCKYQLNKENKLEGVISLVGIDSSYQGLGIGKILMNSVLNYFKKKNIENVYVGTQINNISAMNFYISNKFRVISSINSFHKWININ